MSSRQAYPVPTATPADPLVWEQEIKKSRFITLLAHTPDSEAARAFVGQVRAEHPAARHHCWAFACGAPGDSLHFGFSDDGEPSGTAGKPMLAQLGGCGVGEITAVVVRYSGGIKLGTGGLVKAYGGGVQQALAELTTTEKVAMVKLDLCCAYPEVSTIEHLLAQAGGRVINAEYAGDVQLQCEVDSRQLDSLKSQILEASRGQIRVHVVKEPPSR